MASLMGRFLDGLEIFCLQQLLDLAASANRHIRWARDPQEISKLCKVRQNCLTAVENLLRR